MRSLLLLIALAAGCEETWGVSHADSARRATGGDPTKGKRAIQKYGCGTCHMIEGIAGAHTTVAPPLNGLSGRATLAGKLPNSPTNLVRWIRHPQKIVPGNIMPDMDVTEEDARDIAAFLYTLD